jgi:hypothetical protein
MIDKHIQNNNTPEVSTTKQIYNSQAQQNFKRSLTYIGEEIIPQAV